MTFQNQKMDEIIPEVIVIKSENQRLCCNEFIFRQKWKTFFFI